MKLRWLFLILLTFALGACSSFASKPVTHAVVRPEEFGATFTPAELADDLRFLVQVCEEVHPRPYSVSSQRDIATLQSDLVSKLDRPLTRVEFWPIAARHAAKFGDAHTTVQLPNEEWNAFVLYGGKLLPFALEKRADALIIAQNSFAQSGWLSACELQEVDGIDIGALWTEFRAQRAGEEPFVFASFSANLNWHLWRAGARAPFDLKLERDQAVVPCQIAGLNVEEMYKSRLRAPAPADWSFAWLEGDIALIDFRHMVQADAWDEFLRASFTEIRARPARGVIVDLRRNGGGDSSLGDTLLTYLTDRSYRMCARKEWRSSARYRSYMKDHLPGWVRWLPLQYVSSFGRAFWGVDEGALFVQETEPEAPEPTSLRFAGSWCLLIGPSTFSSATMLANAVGDFELAPLYGAPTGGVPNTSGEVYTCDLPHSRLDVGISSAYFVRANGDGTDTRPVWPTRPCAQTSVDAAAGRDTVLEAARAWLLAQPEP